MIYSFTGKESEKIFDRSFSKKFSKQMQHAAYKKLLVLNAATKLEDLEILPSSQLEKLGEDAPGAYSLQVDERYRIVFLWKDAQAENVEIIDNQGKESPWQTLIRSIPAKYFRKSF